MPVWCSMLPPHVQPGSSIETHTDVPAMGWPCPGLGNDSQLGRHPNPHRGRNLGTRGLAVGDLHLGYRHGDPSLAAHPEHGRRGRTDFRRWIPSGDLSRQPFSSRSGAECPDWVQPHPQQPRPHPLPAPPMARAIRIWCVGPSRNDLDLSHVHQSDPNDRGPAPLPLDIHDPNRRNGLGPAVGQRLASGEKAHP